MAECPAIQNGDESIDENNPLSINITWDADSDALPFKMATVYFQYETNSIQYCILYCILNNSLSRKKFARGIFLI